MKNNMKFDEWTTTIDGQKYTVFAVSVKGEGKKKNQDFYKVFVDENQIDVVVADGLGSARLSEIGSQNACHVLMKHLITTDDLSNIIENVVNEWRDLYDGDINDIDTTLKFIRYKNNDITYGGVGDGWITVLTNKEYRTLTSDNEFLNHTDSLLSYQINKAYVHTLLKNQEPQIMLISTDGFSNDIDIDKGEDFLKAMLSEPLEDLKLDLKNTLSNWEIKSNKDDKTVVVIRKD